MLPINCKFKSDSFNKLFNYSWWLQAVSTTSVSNRAKKLLDDVDKVCLFLEKDKINKKTLSIKVKSLCYGEIINYQINNAHSYKLLKDLTVKEHECRRQIQDFINELRACIWLKNNRFVNIIIVPAEKFKTPDLKASKNNEEYYIEVKTLHRPREEADRLMLKEMQVREVETDYHKALKNKINFFVNDSCNKFKSVNSTNSILIIFYNLSISAYITNSNDGRNLNNILGRKYLNKIEKNKNIRIIEISEI